MIFFAGVTYTIDLSQPEGQRIKDLSFADGQRIQDDSEIRLGMNSYRMGHLTQKGGSLEGRTFPVIFDTEAEYGEDEGTIRNLAIRYLTEEKKGQYEGKLMQRWKLVGLHGYDAEREVVKNLINSGQIDVPSSDDGRYSNIASINVKALKFDSKEMAKEALDTRIKLIEKASSVEKINLNREIVLIKALNDNFLN